MPAQDRLDERRKRDLGLRVRQLRRDLNLSQEQLAHAAGLHRAEVGFIERAEREIGIIKVWRLADALGVEPGDLFKPSGTLPFRTRGVYRQPGSQRD